MFKKYSIFIVTNGCKQSAYGKTKLIFSLVSLKTLLVLDSSDAFSPSIVVDSIVRLTSDASSPSIMVGSIVRLTYDSILEA